MNAPERRPGQPQAAVIGAAAALAAVLRASWQPLLFCTLIAAFSALPGWSYLLFPELAALSSVVLRDPWGPWARRPLLLVLLPSTAAALGLWINLHPALAESASMPLPGRAVAVLLAVVGARLLLAVFRSPLVPTLSAAALPVILNLRSWAYPLQIAIGLAALSVMVLVRRRCDRPLHAAATSVAQAGCSAAISDEQAGQGRSGATSIGAAARTEPGSDRKVDSAARSRGNAASSPAAESARLEGLLRWLGYLALLLVAERLSGAAFLLLPPLIVASHEALLPARPPAWTERPWRIVLAFSVAAAAGVLAARLFAGLPAAATALSLLLCLLLMRRLQLPLPPLLAMGLLPQLLSSPGPPFVRGALIGSAALVLVLPLRRD